MRCRLNFSFIILSFGIMFSCSSSDKKAGMVSLDKLPEHAIHAKQYNKNEIISRIPFEFHRVGNHFFLFNGELNSAALVFRMSDCNMMGHFIPKGMGPGECLSPKFAGCSEGEDSIYIYDFSRGINTFSFPEQLGDTLEYSFVAGKRITNDDLYQSACRLENGLTIACRMSGVENLFTLLDENLDSICSFGGLPLPIKDDVLKDFSMFQGLFCTEGNIFYFGCKQLPYLCAYEIENENRIVRRFECHYANVPYKYDSGRIRLDPDYNQTAFRDLKLNGDCIWGTYSGKSLRTITEEYSNGFCQTLVALNKMGEPLAKYKLPHTGNHICFSEDGKQLFHVTSETNIDLIDVDELLGMIK